MWGLCGLLTIFGIINSQNPFSSSNVEKGGTVTCWLEEKNTYARLNYVKMVARKSSVSTNSINGSLEVGKWTWWERVKFRSKRLGKKNVMNQCKLKRSLIYHRLNEYKCYHRMERSGPNWLNWAEWSEVDQMDRSRLNLTE